LLYNQNEGSEKSRTGMLQQIAKSLVTAGDYGLQANLTEILARIFIWNKWSDNAMKKIFDVVQPSQNEELFLKIAEKFKTIKGDAAFLSQIRSFVFCFNSLCDKYKIAARQVYSLFSKNILLGSYEVGQEFVDFGVKCVSFFVDYPGAESVFVNQKEMLCIDYSNIRGMRLSYSTDALLIQCNENIEGFEKYYNSSDDNQYISISFTKDGKHVLLLLCFNNFIANNINLRAFDDQEVYCSNYSI
jgi:hypothetical protein